MKPAASLIVVLTAVSCLAALARSVYPGVLNDLLFAVILLSFFLLPIAGIAALVGSVLLVRKGKFRNLRLPWRQAAAVVALLASTCVLLKFYIPAASRSRRPEGHSSNWSRRPRHPGNNARFWTAGWASTE